MAEAKQEEKPVQNSEKPRQEARKQEPAQKSGQEPRRQEQKRKHGPKGARDNVIFVGKKPTMSYVLAVVTQFSGGANEVHVKARGRSISHAVDIAEVAKNRFLNSLRREVGIGTEEVTDKEGRKLRVSTIDIKMTK